MRTAEEYREMADTLERPGGQVSWYELMCRAASALRCAAADAEALDRRAAPTQEPVARVETGPVRIGDDWPGVFIRGDDAFGYGLSLQAIMARLPQDDDVTDVLDRAQARDLLARLASCQEPCDARHLFASPPVGQEVER